MQVIAKCDLIVVNWSAKFKSTTTHNSVVIIETNGELQNSIKAASKLPIRRLTGARKDVYFIHFYYIPCLHDWHQIKLTNQK